MEPMTWGVLAASTAGWALNKIAGLAAGTAWKEKVEPAFKRSGLDHELAFAYEAAFKGFVDVLRGPFVIDDAMDLRLREMFADDGFQKILAELPRARFEEVDTARARELFAGLGPPGASPEDFDFAWRTLGRVFSDRIAQTTHASKLAETYRQDRLESYLAEIAESVRPRDESAALAAYRRYVGDLYRLSDTQGLFWREKEPIGEEIRLADVFVEPLIQRQGLEYVPIETEFGGEVVREPIPLPERAQTVADVLAREQRLVILGPPGSGKSTLARCLALALVTEEVKLDTGLPTATVPILLPLKTYAASLRDRSNLPLDDFLEEQLARQLPDFDRILAEGRALVLFDGLDEVFDETHRRWVSAEVSRLMSLHPRSRFVLTSRPQGYRAAPVTGAMPLFEMVAFDDARIRKVFRGWFTALARHGYDHEPGRTPEQRAEALANDVLGRPRIRSLAENPMLCTLIVLTHRSRSGHLPERRVKFYEGAVAVLTEHWERAKHSPKQEVPIEFPEPEQMVGVLAEVAWKAQTELEGREIPGRILESWIEDALADDPGWSNKRKKAARDLLRVIRDRTGLLVDAGSDQFQFVHLSLQDYLVAFYLLDRLDEAQCRRVVRHFLHAPEWEEVLRLAIGAAPRNRADALVRAILDEPTSEWEKISRRDLRFVCRCMEDHPNVSESVLGDVRSRWLKILEDRSYDDETALIHDGVSLGLTPEIRVFFEARLDYGDSKARITAIEWFAKIGADNEAIRAAFEARLGDDNRNKRLSAIEFFAKIGEDDEKTRAIFNAYGKDDDLHVRLTAIEYFARIGAVEPIPAEWRKQLRTKITVGSDISRTAVETLIVDDDWRMRLSAINYFAMLGVSDAKARTAIKGLLSDDNIIVQKAAVKYFSVIGAADEEIRADFEALLGDANVEVRAAAVTFFVETELRNKATAVLDAFVSCNSSLIALQTAPKLSAAIGRHAAEDDALLERITRDQIPRFQRSRALAAAAERRDEIRRMSTPLTTAKRTAMHCA